MSRIYKWVKEYLKDNDMFSQPISLTYKKKSKFQTLYGGIVSSLILVFMVMYGTRLLLIMFSKGATNNSKNTVVHNSNYSEYYTGRDNFSFAMLINHEPTDNWEYDPTYINVTMRQEINSFNPATFKFSQTTTQNSFSV